MKLFILDAKSKGSLEIEIFKISILEIYVKLLKLYHCTTNIWHLSLFFF